MLIRIVATTSSLESQGLSVIPEINRCRYMKEDGGFEEITEGLCKRGIIVSDKINTSSDK